MEPTHTIAQSLLVTTTYPSCVGKCTFLLIMLMTGRLLPTCKIIHNEHGRYHFIEITAVGPGEVAIYKLFLQEHFQYLQHT